MESDIYKPQGDTNRDGDRQDHDGEAGRFLSCGPHDLAQLGDHLADEADEESPTRCSGHDALAYFAGPTAGHALADLSMDLVSAAARAVFIQLEPARVVPTVFIRQVAPLPAFGARQGHEDPISSFSRHVV